MATRSVLPALATQLDNSPTAGEDCGVMAASMAVAYWKEERKGPDRKTIRKRMGQLAGPTNSLNQKTAVESFGAAYRRKVGAPWNRFVTAVENGCWVNVQIDYGVVNDQCRRLSGCKTFDGPHSISVHGIKKSDGRRLVLVYDPLYDGRAAGIPDGPRWWPLWLLKNAAGTFTGTDGTWTGGIIKRADDQPVPGGGPKPKPEPAPEELQKRVTELEAENDRLRERLQILDEALEAFDDARVRLDELIPARTKGDTAQVAAGAVREEGAIDED
jgi:hypothetical protein